MKEETALAIDPDDEVEQLLAMKFGRAVEPTTAKLSPEQAFDFLYVMATVLLPMVAGEWRSIIAQERIVDRLLELGYEEALVIDIVKEVFWNGTLEHIEVGDDKP